MHQQKRPQIFLASLHSRKSCCKLRVKLHVEVYMQLFMRLGLPELLALERFERLSIAWRSNDVRWKTTILFTFV
jgi:hypothetical protein